jgi:ABC-type glycerol-3-phosphate transport system substrate-binding protein
VVKVLKPFIQSVAPKAAAALALLLVSGCLLNYERTYPSVPRPTAKPFDSFAVTNDQTEIAKMVVEALGNTPPDYGFDESDAGKRGIFRYDSSSHAVIFERSLISFDAYNDFNFFPADPGGLLRYKLKDIYEISVVITSVYNGPSTTSMCGLLFGFGNAAGNSSAPSMSTNLSIGGRNWATSVNSSKNPRDFIRFFYNPSNTGERVVVDAGINTYNNVPQYGGFTPSEWRESGFNEVDLINDASDFTKNGDSITYRQTLTVDRIAETITIKIEPLSSNVDMTGWKTSQSFVWNYSATVGATDAVSGNPRGGLDLTNITGPLAMPISDFHNLPFQFGFSANGGPRTCEFHDLKVTLEK